jgi:transposase-like protein
MLRLKSHPPKEKIQKLSVEDRVRAVVHAKLHDDPNKKLSISEICREAGVNRASLYANHRDLLTELFTQVSTPAKQAKPRDDSSDEVAKKVLEQRNKALVYLCLELQLEVRSLRARLPNVRKVTKR